MANLLLRTCTQTTPRPSGRQGTCEGGLRRRITRAPHSGPALLPADGDGERGRAHPRLPAGRRRGRRARAPVEFDSIERIRERFGPGGIAEPAEAYGRVGAITDDTQMTLFTAEGLIRAYVRWATKGICHVP